MKCRTIVFCLMISCSLQAKENNHPVPHLLVDHDASSKAETLPSRPCNWTMTFSNGIGYRRDRQKFCTKTNQSVSYFHHFNTILATGNLLFSWDRLLIKLSGDYGWLVNGDLNFKVVSESQLAKKFPSFQMGSGYSADIDAAIGYCIKLCKLAKSSLVFIPALGYSYSHFNTYPEKQNRSSVSSPPGTSGYSLLEYTRPIQQDWFGPYAEGKIAFSWKDEWRLDFYYRYIPIDFRQTLEHSISNFFFDPSSTLSQTDTVRGRLASKSNTTRTQRGGVDLSYRSPNRWQLGAQFEGSSTWTKTGHSILHIKRTSFLPTSSSIQGSLRERFRVQWVQYSTSFYYSFRF
jgi:hypothetical protein